MSNIISKWAMIAWTIAYASVNACANDKISIAFMPDIHFHDVYGNFSDKSFEGLKSQNNHPNATIRTMYAQLTSTRLFNENYFAMIAALDDMAKRNIKYVVLPGDFSDDGQPIHMRGLVTILNDYQDMHGFEYFAAPGNHDPVRAFTRPAGEKDFLGHGGITQPIYSRGTKYCDAETSSAVETKNSPSVICSDDIKELGYGDLIPMMDNMGFYPQKSYYFWSTPYADYRYDTYNFETALGQSHMEQRQYEICKEGTGGSYKKDHYTNCLLIHDTTYVVEPVNNVWLVGIDANVYVPKDKIDTNNLKSADNLNSPSNAGYNKMVTHKQHVIDWLKQIAQEAEKHNKHLIAFSHYPMVDFDERTAELMADIFGEGKLQLKRVPKEDVTKALADTGIKVHIGGHMHFNDTGVRKYDDGKFLVNIQAPSIAAYVPAYKIVTLNSFDEYHVKTVVLDDVPRFKELFEHYAVEWDYLNQQNSDKLWNKDILNSKNYHEFTDWHLKELTRLRFLPKDWPCALKYVLMSFTAQDLLILSQLEDENAINNLFEHVRIQSLSNIDTENCDKYQEFTSRFQIDSLPTEIKKHWQKASMLAKAKAASEKIDFEPLATWTGYDFAVDFYRIRNADSLALKDVSVNALRLYKFLAKEVADGLIIAKSGDNAQLQTNLQYGFYYIISILDAFLNAEPSDEFVVNLKTGNVKEISY